jgi:hypothetical protein
MERRVAGKVLEVKNYVLNRMGKLNAFEGGGEWGKSFGDSRENSD